MRLEKMWNGKRKNVVTEKSAEFREGHSYPHKKKGVTFHNCEGRKIALFSLTHCILLT